MRVGEALPVDADQEAGDVVVAAGIHGCLDKLGALDRESETGAQKRLDLFVGKLAGQAVGTKQEKIAGLSLPLKHVRGHAILSSEGAGDHVLEGRS